MKRALKGLFRKGEANVVKIVCLSVGLAIGLVMLAEVIFERSYDNFLPGLKETYRVEERYKQKGTDWREHAQTPGAIGPGLQHYCPAVEVATRFTGIGSMTLTTEDHKELDGQAYFCDSTFFRVFPRKLLMGEEPYTGLEKANNAYISSKLLEVAGEQIIGKTLSWKQYPEFHVTVVGVFEAFPENTHLPQMDVLIALPTIGQVSYDGTNNWLGNDRYKTYVRLRKGSTPDDLKEGMDRMLEANHVTEAMERAGNEYDLTLRPVAEIIHFVRLQPHHEHRVSEFCDYHVAGGCTELYPAGGFVHGEPCQGHCHLPLLRGRERRHLPDDSFRVVAARTDQSGSGRIDYFRLAGFPARTGRTQSGVTFPLVYRMGLSGSDGRSDSALRSDAGVSLYPYTGDLRLSPLHGKQAEVETGTAVLAVRVDHILCLPADGHRPGV